MDKIKLGFAPTRRNLFSADAAIEYANYTREKLDTWGIDYVDIQDINADGLIYDDASVEAAAAKFKAEGIDGLFIANENFGTEYAVARLAKKLMCQSLFGDQKMKRQHQTVHVYVILNVVFLPLGKCSVVLKFHSLM